MPSAIIFNNIIYCYPTQISVTVVTLQDLKLQLQRIDLKGTVQLAEDNIITSLKKHKRKYCRNRIAYCIKFSGVKVNILF